MSGVQTKKTSWAQPSLSRDFALLSAAILFMMLLISAWVAWITYVKHSERIVQELEKETDRIERTLESEIFSTGHLLAAMGHQIARKSPSDLRDIAELLQTYFTGNPQYALWSWSDVQHRIRVSNKQGIIEEPVDISDRDYVRHSSEEPGHPYIGVPVEGRVSGRWVIPLALGVADATGKYIGTLTASIDINTLTEQITHLVKREGISFAVVSKAFVPLTVVADNDTFILAELPIERLKALDLQKQKKGVISQAGLLSRNSIYSYYLVSEKYPYIIVVGYDSKASDSAIRSLLWPRMIQIGVVAGFLLSFLWIIRTRVIKPVVELGHVAGRVATGGGYRPLRNAGPQEIEQLAVQIRRISEYITERRRLEEELRSKINQLHRNQQKIQMESRQRSVLLAGLLAEYKKSLRSINSHAQVLKDQLYGPIEDRKYRQFAADIHQTGTTLELMVRKLIALSRVDAAAVITRDEPVPLAALLENARRFVAELPEGGSLAMRVPDGEAASAVLQIDGMHVQQALAYALLYLISCPPAGAAVEIGVFKMPGLKARESLVLTLSKGALQAMTEESVRREIEGDAETLSPAFTEEGMMEQMHLTLAKAMLELQGIELRAVNAEEEGACLLIHFPAERVAE